MKLPRALSPFPLCAALFCAPFSRSEIPTITVSKSDKLSLALTAFTGPDAAQDMKLLQNDLAMSGYFTFVPPAGAGFVIGGTSSGSSLAGNVTDRGG